jgi:hypothetical protein
MDVDGALIQQLIDKNQHRYRIEDRFSLNATVEINESGMSLSAIATNERGEALLYSTYGCGFAVVKLVRRNARWRVADMTTIGELALC